jgi:hypothetical protein
VSSVIVQINILKKRGVLNPKKVEIELLNSSIKIKKRNVVIVKLIKEVDTIFPFSFSLEKKRKKAVSIP